MDYYIYTSLVVKFDDDMTMTINLSREGHYLSVEPESHDSDSEGDIARANEKYEQMKYNEISRSNSQKLLFKDGEWLITSTDKISEYKNKIIELLTKRARSQALALAEAEAEAEAEDETSRLHLRNNYQKYLNEPNYQKYLNEFPNSIKTVIKSTEGIER